MNNTVAIIGKENQYEYRCGSCGVTAYGHKGRCTCDDCKAKIECELRGIADPATTEEDRRRAVYLFFEAAVRGWKDEPANRYADLNWNEIIYRTATSYADAILKSK